MMDEGAVRNLEQIQETDAAGRTPRGTTIALVVMGTACIVFAVLALGGRKTAPTAAPSDPLGDLVLQHRGHVPSANPSKPTDLSAKDVTFPGILSDDTSPTTALAAVRGGSLPPDLAPTAPTLPVTPPPPTDRLSVVPLPAQNVLEATPMITRPRDPLTKAAAEAAQTTANASAASSPGHDGGYQLQVSSFRAQTEANEFAEQLRARGHKAYVLEAHVAGRGTWYRVRVGPFSTQHAAQAYRGSFESKEHVVPFIVPPVHDSHDPHEAKAP